MVKQVKVERPRPLKIGGGAHPELSLDDLLVVIDGLRKSLGVKGEGEHILGQLQLLSANLKISGHSLEISHKVSRLFFFVVVQYFWYVFHPPGPDGQVEQLPHVGLQVGLLEPGGQGPHA